MRVPNSLSLGFGPEFQELLASFCVEEGLLAQVEDLANKRYLTRSIAPHVEKLSALFNRAAELKAEREAKIRLGKKADIPAPELGLDPYWKSSSNPEHLRLAYFLSFMPPNLYRVASVWAELTRLGFRWKGEDRLRAIELGAGSAAGACGIAAGEHFSPGGLPRSGDWALIEQDRATLQLGVKWAERYFTQAAGQSDWGIRPFHRKLELEKGLLPRTAPKFNLWVLSYFLNEFSESPDRLAGILLDTWDRHLAEEGIVIIVEPALRLISRKLLELRRELLAETARRKRMKLQILLPCLGHQACGALADAEDWCHEDVSWWRPPYLRQIDELTRLDRKSLPFSYLVLVRTERTLVECLPELAAARTLHRLVSPAHAEGREHEFFLCGQDGKRRARYRPTSQDDEAPPVRGDILCDAEVRGNAQSSRVESFRALK